MKKIILPTLITSMVVLSACSNSSKIVVNTKPAPEVIEKTGNLGEKIDFTNISNIRNKLSGVGIGELGSWKSDMMGGYMSITDYYQFGNDTPKNNLAYYLEGENESSVKTIKLTLNLNNKVGEKEIMETLSQTIQKTFDALGITTPEGLIEAAKSSKNFSSDNANFTTELKLEKSNIDTWNLAIKSK